MLYDIVKHKDEKQMKVSVPELLQNLNNLYISKIITYHC
jgi:hypothetical protein